MTGALTGLGALAPVRARAQSAPYAPYVPPAGSGESFARYIEGVKAEARRRGIAPTTLE
ncbi:MAG: hypothetical protein JO157_06200, partial [Acetobacteraceae bacterium]|nr:hypothetical protein [Acetobacteraceae bacterium]